MNKNAIAGDRSAVAPGGVRLGTPAMTTRGLGEEDFEEVADLLSRAADLALEAQAAAGSKKLADFVRALEGDFKAQVEELKGDVEAFAQRFPMPGPAAGGPIP